MVDRGDLRGYRLRAVQSSDIEALFRHHADPVAQTMAAFASRPWDAFVEHWQTRILDDPAVVKRVIEFDGQVAGSIVGFERDNLAQVGYWLGRAYWGRGLATRALREFLQIHPVRPLHAFVARHNLGSMRVVAKCGFLQTAVEVEEVGDGSTIEVLRLTLDHGPSPTS